MNQDISDCKTIRVHAPATVANMVCGFDVLGFCLDEPYDVMTLTLLEGTSDIRIRHVDDHDLPTEPSLNVAGAALIALQEELETPVGFEVVIDKRIKPGSGVGSSAASAAGAVVAANHLLGGRFDPTTLVRFAMCGEKVASGVKHADNIAPCIYGGVTLIRAVFPLDIVPLPAPSLFASVVHPQIEVRTSDARQILMQKVFLKDAIKQWGNIAGLVAGILKGDKALISRSLEDVLIEPVRKILIPGFDLVKERSLAAGALGGGISGSGPSIFMLSADRATADAVAGAMADVYRSMGIDHHTYVGPIAKGGVRIVA
ncbi:homoserine kinase [Dinghuibacter silviterrae]|uniref:Homoserine kinase n=1 Tax=Dinghuibacter silviterrae TaxID=1539049 RepID=A0A4R8DT27_9BACT|nr:homoserine kinase [Dinghuibacter silviterrae]TDX01048.1 homoserine kinase [Dinghuibacter silviterrae]